MNTKTGEILSQVERVIIGKNEIVQKVLMSILAGGHILLEDVPGVGKTTLALAFSRVLGLDYNRIQFTSDSLPSDIIGFSVYNKQSGELEYKRGAVMTNLLLADEINRTSSKTQSALLEVMEEGNVTVDGVTHQLEKPFIVIATQNPLGSAGTQMLPNSQLDRFMIKLAMGYPDTASQINILRDRHTENPLEALAPVASREELIATQAEVVAVHIDDGIYEYVTSLAEETRQHPLVQLGLSPRGALALCRMAKAHAYVLGRDYVTPDDIAAVFCDVCGHRVMLKPKAKITETSAADVLNEIIGQVRLPAAV